MSLPIKDRITILLVHRDNLEKARDFEEYRKLHIAYVDWLIDGLMATKQAHDAVEKFANKSENKEND